VQLHGHGEARDHKLIPKTSWLSSSHGGHLLVRLPLDAVTEDSSCADKSRPNIGTQPFMTTS
jgi:hypothetical protein